MVIEVGVVLKVVIEGATMLVAQVETARYFRSTCDDIKSDCEVILKILSSPDTINLIEANDWLLERLIDIRQNISEAQSFVRWVSKRSFITLMFSSQDKCERVLKNLNRSVEAFKLELSLQQIKSIDGLVNESNKYQKSRINHEKEMKELLNTTHNKITKLLTTVEVYKKAEGKTVDELGDDDIKEIISKTKSNESGTLAKDMQNLSMNDARGKLDQIVKELNQHSNNNLTECQEPLSVVINQRTPLPLGYLHSGKFKGKDVSVRIVEAGNSASLKSVKREIMAMSLFQQCENIASIETHFLIYNQYYIVTEKLSMDNLYVRLEGWSKNAKSPSLRYKLKLLEGISNGLALLHQMGIVHKNFKSPSILFNQYDVPLITDFSVIKFDNNNILSSIAPKDNLPFYWRAPETISPSSAYTQASDVYALGVIIWEVLTGSKPFGGERDSGRLLGMIRNDKILPGSFDALPNQLPSLGLRRRVEEIITSCWNGDPNSRPSAETVLYNLQEISENFSE